MTALQAIFLGLVQGLTEFLPISSSGHLSIFQNLFGMEAASNENLFFDVLLHLGTLVSVCIAYRRDLQDIWTDCLVFFNNLQRPVPGADERRYPGARLLLMIGIGTLPLFLILPVHNQIERLYNSTAFIGIALILTGALLYVSDRFALGRKNEKSMTFWDALLVGGCQAIATFPGLSRSGATITAGLCSGFNRQFAVKFAFLLSIPAVFGANILTLIDAIRAHIDWTYLPSYLLGGVTAMITGYFAIFMLRYIIRRGKFGYFAYYCAFAGVLTLILTLILR